MSVQRETSHFSLIDWDFKTEDSRSFVHNFCWYPSRFIPVIPCHLIKSLSHAGDTVLDPFCGSGTTVLEALKLGRNAIGIDLNPIATFITSAKVNVLNRNNISIQIIETILKDIDHLNVYANSINEINLFERESDLLVDNIPNILENSAWYHPLTLRMLGHLYNSIIKIENIETRNLLLVFFISILIPSSSHENKKPYTYYADNVKPKDHTFKNSLTLYSKKLRSFCSDFTSSIDTITGIAEILTDDVRNLKTCIKSDTPVDLVITSPPYLGVTDYVMGYRLVYLWNIIKEDYTQVKRSEIGARWRRKQATGTVDYLNALEHFLFDAVSLLKIGGYICLIIGESKKYREIVISDLTDYAKNILHLELQDTYCRNVSKNYFIHPKGGVPTEDILIFQRKK